MKRLHFFTLPTHTDERGDLTAIELKDYIDWVPKRIYYVTNVTLPRGAHAVRGERKIYVCMQGSVKARFHDGNEWQEFEMEGPGDAVLMDGLYWREFIDFAPNTVLMAISNLNYDRNTYILDFEAFKQES